ncbi:MAG: hypothetical protein JWQ87_2656 [Candidatus Sulfotelmatobacter sp.]|nr:hypothetical protein [Candidatus Sulfotelmatobacter sp.]
MPGVAGSTDDIPQAPPNAPPVGSTSDLENQAQNAPGQLGQALQSQQQNLQNQQQPSPQQPADDPLAPVLDSMVQRRSELMQQTAPSPSGGVKGMLSNFFKGMGGSMMTQAGMASPQQQLQDLDNHIATLTNARSDYLNSQTNAQLRQAQTQNLNRPLTPELAASIGHPELSGQVVAPDVMQSISSENRGKEAADINAQTRADALKESTPQIQMPLDQKTADLLNIPSQFVGKNLSAADWKLIDSRSQALGYQKQDMGFDGPKGGIWMMDRAGNPLHQITPVSESNRATKLAAGGGAAVYAYNPVSKSTLLTTMAQAQAGGMQAVRPVKESDIKNDQHDIRVLNDLATKANAVYQSAGVMDTKDFANALGVARYLSDHPNTTSDSLINSAVLAGLSPAAQKYVINTLSLRESSMGLQKVLTGSARSNETQLRALLATLPGLEGNGAISRQKLDAFTQNVDLLRQGIPRIPGMDVVPVQRGNGSQSLSPGQVQVTDPSGGVHTFPDQNSADNFKRLAGIR